MSDRYEALCTVLRLMERTKTPLRSASDLIDLTDRMRLKAKRVRTIWTRLCNEPYDDAGRVRMEAASDRACRMAEDYARRLFGARIEVRWNLDPRGTCMKLHVRGDDTPSASL